MTGDRVSSQHVAALRFAVDALARQPESEEARCFYCLAPATLLCDGALARIKREESDCDWDVVDTDRDDWMVTCDRPMCDDCATNGGMTFYKMSGGGCELDTSDYCRDCHGYSSWVNVPLMSKGDAKAVRRRQAIRPLGEYDSLHDLSAPLGDLLAILDTPSDTRRERGHGQ